MLCSPRGQWRGCSTSGVGCLPAVLRLHTPTPGTPGVSAGMLVWALGCGGKAGRNDSHCRGFMPHRPEFKSRPCWLCDLGRGALPLGSCISPLARQGNQPLWSAGQWGQNTSWGSRPVTSSPLPPSASPPSGGTPTLCRGTPRQGEQGAEEDPARGRRMGE